MKRILSAQMRGFIFVWLLTACVAQVAEVQAAPDEITVYTDEMNAPGEFAVETHLNYVIAGTQTAAYPGQLPSEHVLQVTPEFSYGLSRSFEAGLYVPFAFAPDGNSYFNDFRARLKYIAPHQSDEKWFCGLNMEMGNTPLRTSASASVMEIKPIIGYRDERWLVSFNPVLNMAPVGIAGNQLSLNPAFKWAHSVNGQLQAGFEYYGEYGALNSLAPADQLAHTLYVVGDMAIRTLDVNFGIGHGYVNAGDAWVAKTSVALSFN